MLLSRVMWRRGFGRRVIRLASGPSSSAAASEVACQENADASSKVFILGVLGNEYPLFNRSLGYCCWSKMKSRSQSSFASLAALQERKRTGVGGEGEGEGRASISILSPNLSSSLHRIPRRDINLGSDLYSDVFDGESPAVHVKGFDEDGHFVMGNGTTLRGSLLCYSGKVFVWEGIKSVCDISCNSLSILRAVKPKPDLLVIGYGHKEARGEDGAASLSEKARRMLYDLNISFELASACGHQNSL